MKRFSLIPSLFILCLAVLSSTLNGQIDSLDLANDLSIKNDPKFKFKAITGFHIQKNQFAELGIGFVQNSIMGNHQSSLIYALSNELRLSKDFIWGLKAGLWFGGGSAGMNVGLNLINYTDFESSSLRFRPEIGIGIVSFRVVYGYNFRLTNPSFSGINLHNFGVNLLF